MDFNQICEEESGSFSDLPEQLREKVAAYEDFELVFSPVLPPVPVQINPQIPQPQRSKINSPQETSLEKIDEESSHLEYSVFGDRRSSNLGNTFIDESAALTDRELARVIQEVPSAISLKKTPVANLRESFPNAESSLSSFTEHIQSFHKGENKEGPVCAPSMQEFDEMMRSLNFVSTPTSSAVDLNSKFSQIFQKHEKTTNPFHSDIQIESSSDTQKMMLKVPHLQKGDSQDKIIIESNEIPMAFNLSDANQADKEKQKEVETAKIKPSMILLSQPLHQNTLLSNQEESRPSCEAIEKKEKSLVTFFAPTNFKAEEGLTSFSFQRSPVDLNLISQVSNPGKRFYQEVLNSDFNKPKFLTDSLWTSTVMPPVQPSSPKAQPVKDKPIPEDRVCLSKSLGPNFKKKLEVLVDCCIPEDKRKSVVLRSSAHSSKIQSDLQKPISNTCEFKPQHHHEPIHFQSKTNIYRNNKENSTISRFSLSKRPTIEEHQSIESKKTKISGTKKKSLLSRPLTDRVNVSNSAQESIKAENRSSVITNGIKDNKENSIPIKQILKKPPAERPNSSTVTLRTISERLSFSFIVPKDFTNKSEELEVSRSNQQSASEISNSEQDPKIVDLNLSPAEVTKSPISFYSEIASCPQVGSLKNLGDAVKPNPRTIATSKQSSSRKTSAYPSKSWMKLSISKPKESESNKEQILFHNFYQLKDLNCTLSEVAHADQKPEVKPYPYNVLYKVSSSPLQFKMIEKNSPELKKKTSVKKSVERSNSLMSNSTGSPGYRKLSPDKWQRSTGFSKAKTTSSFHMNTEIFKMLSINEKITEKAANMVTIKP